MEGSLATGTKIYSFDSAVLILGVFSTDIPTCSKIWTMIFTPASGLNYDPPKFLCWSSNPQYLRMWLYLEKGPLKNGLSWNEIISCCYSVAKSCLTLCDPHELQHARLPCPSLSPGVCSDSCPLSRWCYLTISPSATPISFCLQSFPASGSFSSELALHI